MLTEKEQMLYDVAKAVYCQQFKDYGELFVEADIPELAEQSWKAAEAFYAEMAKHLQFYNNSL